MSDSAELAQTVERVRVFVDYWNLQLTANERLGRDFTPDWRRIPRWLGVDAVRLAIGDASLPLRLDGLNVYASYNPASAADMIRLAWEESYDHAVLVSSDADYVPAVEFLISKGRRVIHVGFPPKGMDLAKTCWASLNMAPYLASLERSVPGRPTSASG